MHPGLQLCYLCFIVDSRHTNVYVDACSNLHKCFLITTSNILYIAQCSDKKLKNVFTTGLPVLGVQHRLGKPENLWNQKERNGNLSFL